ncbi:hypothetical protein ACHAXT_003137 [Thalassiosira profunda]
MEMAAEEDPFELIKKGNAHEAASDHWRSAECYCRASACLRAKADGLSAEIRRDSLDDASIAEKRKVVSLFRAQSLEYMYKARHCLLEALRFENEQDRSRTLEVAKSGTGSLDPLFSLIDAEESQRRRRVFETLFAGSAEASTDQNDEIYVATQEGKGEEHSGVGTASTADAIDDRQQSIESRLAQLDSTLLPKVPPPFISGSRNSGGGSDKNRLAEIQAGLGRLGVHLPPESKKSDMIRENLSDEDQMKLIIQQAQDEVRFEQGDTGGSGSEVNGIVDAALDGDVIDENDSMFEGFEDDDLDIDALLSKAETLVAKTGINVDEKGESSPELAQIRKAQALLLEARLCLEMVQAKSGDERTPNIPDKEEEDDAEDSAKEPDPSANEAKVAARKKARERIESAELCMNAILKGWK